jgi:eukaryotic-like serine/threonine-protein kinase
VLLTGRLVHEAETTNELLLAAMTRRAPPIASIEPSVPDDVAGLIDRALIQEQDARWVDARAMQAAVIAAQKRLASEPAPRARTPSVTDRPRPPEVARSVTATELAVFPIPPAAEPAGPAFVPPAPAAPVITASPVAAAAPPVAPALVVAPPAYLAAHAFGHAPGVLGPGSPGLATGQPVTMGPAAQGFTAVAPPAPSRAGLFIALGLGAALVLGGGLWLGLGRSSPVPASPPPGDTSVIAAPTAVETAPAPTAVETAPAPTAAAAPAPSGDPSAAPDATDAPTASPAESGKKPLRTKTVQDLLNRRR